MADADPTPDGAERGGGREGTTRLTFSCPHCGAPSARPLELDVDIHSGAIYRCSECGCGVVFSVEAPDDYARRLRDAPPEGVTIPRGVARLAADGCEVRADELSDAGTQAYGGGDEERGEDLQRRGREYRRVVETIRDRLRTPRGRGRAMDDRNPAAYRARDDSYREATGGEWMYVPADQWTERQMEALRHVGWRIEPLYTAADLRSTPQGESDG